MESLEESSEAAKPLQHPTKSRAKRPNNRQRPSKTGNPQAVVESVEQEAENLDVPMASSTKERQNSTKEILIVEETDCNVEGEPAKKQSPNHQLNQPKIKWVEMPLFTSMVMLFFLKNLSTQNPLRYTEFRSWKKFFFSYLVEFFEKFFLSNMGRSEFP